MYMSVNKIMCLNCRGIVNKLVKKVFRLPPVDFLNRDGLDIFGEATFEKKKNIFQEFCIKILFVFRCILSWLDAN